MASKKKAAPQRAYSIQDLINEGIAYTPESTEPTAAADPQTRTWGQAIGDTAAQLAEGVNTTLGAIPSIVAPDGSTAGFFRDNADYWRDKQSDVLKKRIAATDQRIQEAGKEGVMSQIGTAVSEYWNDPAQAARLVATNLPSMAATLGTGALAGAAAKGVAAARGLGAAGEAALAAQYGTRTAMATNAALNAGGARGEAYEDLKRAALAQGMSPEQAEQAALDGSVMPGVVSGVAGAVSGKLGLEKALLGQPGAGAGTALRRAAGAFGAELAGEQIEEVAPKLTTNYEAGKIDPARSLTDDLGRTMVETTIGAGPGAVVAGGVEGMSSPAQAAADTIRATEKVPESGALTKAVNAGVEAKAQAVEAGAPPPTLGARLTDTDMGSMLGGGGMTGRADPLAGALGMNNEAQASSITNVANVAERRPPMPASDALRMLDEARNRGLDLAVVEHPNGGFVLIPPTWVTPDMAAQGEARLNETISRMQQADAAPVERAPRTRTDGVGLNLQTDPVQNYLDSLRSVNTPAARAYVRDFDAGRITPADVQQRIQAERGLTPEQRIASAAAEAPAQTDPVADRLARAAAQGMATPAPTDILNPAGEPFKTKMAADRAAKKTPGAVVPVEGGFVVRPQEPVNVQDVPQAPEVPQAAPVVSQPGQAPQAVGAQPAGPAAGVPTEGVGAVEAAGLSLPASQPATQGTANAPQAAQAQQASPQSTQAAAPAVAAGLTDGAPAAKSVAQAGDADAIATLIQQSIAENRIKANEKIAREKVAKGYLTQEQADADLQRIREGFANTKPNQWAQALAKAIAEKDPLPLVGAWAKEGQGTYGVEGSMAGFEKATGVKLRRLNSTDRAKAIFDWAGWTEEQVAADVAERRKLKAESDAAREAKSQAEYDDRITERATKELVLIKDTQQKLPIKEYVDGLIAQGYNTIRSLKRGAITKTYLANERGEGYPLPVGVMRDYAQAAVRRAAAPNSGAQRASAPQAEAAQPATPQQDGNDFLPEGWSKSVNGYTKRPVYRMEHGVGQPFAVVTQTEGMTYEVQIRHGDKQLTTGTQRGALSEVLAAAEAELGRMKQADSVTHADPGEKAEAATPAVVTDSLKKAARNEDTKPSEMRKWLVAEIDKELLQAADRPDYDEAVKRLGEKDAISMFTGNGPLGKNSETGYITFDVPGDGKYKVRNSVRGLLEFRKNVMASPGFKDGGQRQNTQQPEQTDSARNGSGSTVEAIRNFLADGDVQGAVEFAKLKGVEFTPVEPRASMTANGKFKRVPASVSSKPPSVAEGLTQVEAEQINQYLTAEQARAEPADAQDADVQPSPQDFIPAPDGGLDYGEITPEMGKAMRRQAGKIRLRRGDETQGLVHIENRHNKDFAALGFKSAQDFVSQVASGFTKIYKGRGAALDVVLDDQARGMLIVSLEQSGDGDFYDIKTATPIRRDQFKNEEPLWDRAGPSASTADEGSPPYPKGQNGVDSVPPTATAAQPDTPKLTPTEAKSLMAWEDLGQKDGVKTHALTFYESQADKDAKRGRMIVAKVSKGDRSATAWMVDGEDKTFGALAQAKKLAEEVGMAKAVADGFVEQGDDAPMFSRAQAKEVRNLVTLHNLTDENLRFADSMGGIPVPSIGITKVDSPFSGFGNITLIASKGMVDPESGVPVFDRDAWTARFPEMNFKKPRRAKADAFYERMKAMTNGLGVDEGNFLSNLWESMVNASVINPDKVADHLRRYDAARMAYARDVLGKNIKVPMRSVPLSSPAANDKQLQAYWKKNGQRLIELEYELSGSNFSNTPEYKSFVREVEGAVRRYAEASGKPERADAYVSMFLPDGELGPGGFDRLGRDFAAVGKKEVDGLKLREAVRKVVPDNDPAYLQWVSDQVKPLFDAPTITLRGKEVEPTLDNIVDAMTVGATAGVEKSMTFGPGKLAAHLGKRFKSMAEIKAARDQVVSESAETEAKKATDAILDEYRTHLAQFFTFKDWRGNIDTWAANDSSMEALARAGKQELTDANIRAALSRKDFKGVDQRGIDLARQAIEALRSTATNYFEAKPQRAVRLNEFKGAVVPKGIPPESVAILEKNGITVEFYGKAEGAREKAIEKLAKRLDRQSGDVLFARSETPPADSNARNVATKLLIDGLKSKWTRAPEIIVARNMQDAQITQEVRDYDALLKSQGATGEPRGFIYQGKVYLLSDQLKGPQQIAEVLFHEVLGHYGLRGAFGDGLTPILKQLGALRRKEVVAKAREYGLFNKDALGGLDKTTASDSQVWDAMSDKQRLDAAEEVLAEMAQTKPELGYVKRAIAAIRTWLRQNVPGFKELALTDAEIIRSYVIPARGFVERGRIASGAAVGALDPAFSLGDGGMQSGGLAPMSPSPAKTPLYEAFRQLARFGDAFQLRGSNATDLAEIAQDMQEGTAQAAQFTAAPSTALHRGTRKKTLALYTKGLDGERHKLLDIFEADSDRPFVVIGNSEVGQRARGARAYQIAFAWAHNNGKTMRPDPAGLTVINRLRRSEAMISSALRFGTTRHLEPHADQYIALAPTTRRLGAEPEDTHYSGNPQLHGELEVIKEKLWTPGDDAATIASNVQHLIEASAQIARMREPALRDLEVVGGTLRNRRLESSVPLGDLAAGGQDATRSIAGITRRSASTGVGHTTAVRYAVTASVARAIPDNGSSPAGRNGQDSRDRRSGDAAAVRAIGQTLGRLDGGAPEGLSGILYSRTPGDQTQTEAFKRWFKDSKVVDSEGKPLVVYHGTRRQFNEFSPSKPRGAPGNPEGIYFTADKWAAEEYAQDADGAWDEKSRVVSAYIKIENDADGKIIDSAYRGREYVVFKPENIKSATGNNGDFDPTNPDIRFSRTTDAAKAVGDTLKSITVANVKQRAGFKLTDYLGIGLQALGRRQIVDIYGDMLPLGEYNRLVQQMEADKNEGSAEADQLVTLWAELPDEKKLADLMHDATLAQIDPAEDFVEGDDKGKYLELRRKYNLLSDEAKKVYADTRDSYKAHHAKVRSAIKERIERSEIKGERKAALLKQMDDEFFKAVKGVYFPLARFGQYAVTVKGPDGKVESVSRAETKAEAEALRNNLLSAFPRDKGFTVGRVMLSKDFIADRDAVGRGFMTELYQVLDQQNMDAAQRAELEDTLGQLYLSSLPDLSWAKHGIHRKGTPGFSQDARRAFAQNMFHGARYLAKLRYSDLMQDELAAMQKHVDDWREVEDFDQNSAQRVVDEMNKRHESLMNPKSNPLSTALTSLGFVFHLGLSPASAMVNLSQTALVAYPIMGAKWGFGKASAALLKASAEAAKGKNDITGSLNADELAAYNEAVRAGTIDVTMAHDLAGIAQGEDAGVMWKIRPVMRWASFMFHHAERFNRQVTFVAAYRLAREAGADQKAAFEQATKATYDGHSDYSAANRPRIMQGNVAKVLLLFKQYGQNMVYTLARNAQQSIKGESPEVRAQARKALGGLLATHAAAAGVLGLPMVTTLLAAASMIGGDDDEPWDAKVALQNMLADTFGQKPAEVLAHGLSRLTPWDISGRVGLDKLIFPDVQEGLEGQRLGEAAMAAALGPVAGIGINVLKGLQDMSQGQYARGLEAMMPAALRGPIKAIRYESEGVQDKTGVVIKDDVSLAGVAGQFLGFSPSEVRNATEGKSAVIQQDRALGERRQELLTKAARATMAKDAEARAEAMKEIERFNQKNPTRRITPLNVLQSVRNRQKRIDQAEGGVYLPKNRRDAMEAGRFAVIE